MKKLNDMIGLFRAWRGRHIVRRRLAEIAFGGDPHAASSVVGNGAAGRQRALADGPIVGGMAAPALVVIEAQGTLMTALGGVMVALRKIASGPVDGVAVADVGIALCALGLSFCLTTRVLRAAFDVAAATQCALSSTANLYL